MAETNLDLHRSCRIEQFPCGNWSNRMPHISGSTLMMAIQAIDSKINDIEKQLEAAEHSDVGDSHRTQDI